MPEITKAGYIGYDIVQWKAQLENDATLEVVGYTNQPAEIQNNLITESALILKHVEDIIALNINNMLPYMQNETAFAIYGEGLGLPYKNATQTSVVLVFTGLSGTYIPSGLAVSDTNGTITVTTANDGVITSDGTVSLLAYTVQTGITVIPANTITKMSENISGVTVNNPVAGTAGQEAETFEQYRKRVHTATTIKSYGQFDYLYTQVANVEGVDMRHFNAVERRVQQAGQPPYMYTEIVVGGGDDIEVALAIDKGAGLSGRLYSSNPSDGNVDRTITVNLRVFNTARTVIYTRPKQSNLSIVVVTRSKKTIDLNLPYLLSYQQLQDYFNTVSISEDISLNKITDIILDSIAFLVDRTDIGAFTYTIRLDGVDVTQESVSTGFIPLAFDQFPVLTDYGITIQNLPTSGGGRS